MKKLYVYCMLLVSSRLFCAATEQKSPSELFEQAKKTIALDMPGALYDLTVLPVHEYQEEYKQLLEYALRNTGLCGQDYVKDLTLLLEKNTPDGTLGAHRKRPVSLRRSETLSLMDIAIMTGNVDGVKEILRLGSDLSVCRLITIKDRRPLTVKATIDLLLKARQASGYNCQNVTATTEQLQQIRGLIHEHTKTKKSLLKRITSRLK